MDAQQVIIRFEWLSVAELNVAECGSYSTCKVLLSGVSSVPGLRTELPRDTQAHKHTRKDFMTLCFQKERIQLEEACARIDPLFLKAVQKNHSAVLIPM